jgi:predicted phosphodiesterase
LSITNRASVWPWVKVAALSASVFLLTAFAQPQAADKFSFALLGDRTGETQPGVYLEAWRETIAEHPAFVLTVGDTIQGYDDKTIDSEWRQVFEMLAPFHRYPLFLTPGNHDVWDAESSKAYVKYSGHPLHYSFDWQQAHFTILNNSESDDLKPEEISFLEQDLEAHKAQPLKFIVSHRPSWLFPVVLRDPGFPLHQLARKYGVKYVIAGHIHQMLHFELDGITYLSMASSGGHLRNDKEYRHGWFFEHTEVSVSGASARIQIKELNPPFGKSRVTTPANWGAAGLLEDIDKALPK